MRLKVKMLSKAILKYLQQHEQEFDAFVVELFKMNEEGGVQVRCRAGDEELLVTATGVGSGMQTLRQSEFALKLEDRNRPRGVGG
jgi:hypothetical protein